MDFASSRQCCVSGIRWSSTPQGEEATLARRGCYISIPPGATSSGSNSNSNENFNSNSSTSADGIGILVIHDLFGWTFPNMRILADHYAEEVGATVYVPDFFGGEVLPAATILDTSQWHKLDLPNFLQRNSKSARTPEIFEIARILRSKHTKVGAIGFCFGGWGVFRLGATPPNTESSGTDQSPLVDCISTAHPTDLEHSEIENVRVPVQIMAPEHDPRFTEELKAFANKVIPTLGVPYDYQFFPGLEHVFAVRGDPEKPNERRGMERAKNAAVSWFREWLVER